MNPTQTPTELSEKKCVPCEGGVPGYSATEAQAQIAAMPLWRLTHLGTRIRRDWTLQNFRAGIKLLNTIGAALPNGSSTIRICIWRDTATHGSRSTPMRSVASPKMILFWRQRSTPSCHERKCTPFVSGFRIRGSPNSIHTRLTISLLNPKSSEEKHRWLEIRVANF